MVGLRTVGIPYDPIAPPYLAAAERAQLRALIDHRPTYVKFHPVWGWAVAPNAVSADGWYYSSGQALRADHEYAVAPPANGIRLLAYGDSFTHSDEVNYEDSWGARLGWSQPDLEVVNCGVSGYSLDQALLRFEANDPPFGADIVVIGFMAENINRLVNVFRPFYVPGGTPLAKPRFRVRDDELVLVANPLQSEDDLQRLLDGDLELFARLGEQDYWYDVRPRAGPEDVFASVRLLKGAWSAAKRVVPRDALIDWRGNYKTTSEGFAISVKLFQRFTCAVEQRGLLPIIVLFPSARDVLRGSRYRHAPLTAALRDRGLRVIDLADALDQAPSVYGVTEQHRHYPAAANAVVAETIRRYLAEHDLLRRDRIRDAVARQAVAPCAGLARTVPES